ncbi:carboxymuconolactone decarboxylase family protein [Taibaiella helva]|uniref:carboxymuconolactone decarboxylase family protein n=1 Tax=Taibaiella helva TaxID=2301235 RepID=UPI000E5971CF|nr:carboxymuconolactone decarboxylase family protein [Taibaiella helva]
MRIKPIPPEALSPEARYVHEEIVKLTGHSQGQVNMMDKQGALLGPFPAMLQYPQFGVPALTFLRSLDHHATLPKAVREVAILTVAGILGARFELYAHEIMARAYGIAQSSIATLAAAGKPAHLNEPEAIAHDIAAALVRGRIVPDATYNLAADLLGKEGVAELYFLVGGYCLIAMILNGFDIPAPCSPSGS